MAALAGAGLTRIASNFAADPVNSAVKYGKNMYIGIGLITSLAWYNSWRNQLDGVGKFEVPIPGITNKQKGGAPDRPDPAPPPPGIDITNMTTDNPNLPGGAIVTTAHHIKWGRLDQGQDLQVKPGSALKSLGNGIVKYILNDPGGFGTNYPVIHYTSGPLAGEDVYYGHTHSLLRVGDSVIAGQLFTKTGFGTAKEGNARTPGWAEIGYWPPGSKSAQKIAPILHRHM